MIERTFYGKLQPQACKNGKNNSFTFTETCVGKDKLGGFNYYKYIF